MTPRYNWKIIGEAKRPWDISVIVSNSRNAKLFQIDVDWKWGVDREIVSAIQITALTKTHPVNGKLLTQLPLPAIEREIRRVTLAAERSKVSQQSKLARSRGPKPGQPLTMEHLQWVTNKYTEASRAGKSPRAVIAKLMHISPSTAAKQIMAARAAGMIPASPRRNFAGATK